METFDELFDSFFNSGKKKIRKSRGKKLKNDDTNEKIKNIIDTLSNFQEITDENVENDLDLEMGEPNHVHFFEDGGMYFKRSIWEIKDKGELIKLEVSDLPFEESIPKKTLEELLEDAVKEENYEKAAEIRDEMKKMKKK
jgi:protein-arginine kinase activator protein McsA